MRASDAFIYLSCVLVVICAMHARHNIHTQLTSRIGVLNPMNRWLSDGFIYIDRDYPWEQHPGKSGRDTARCARPHHSMGESCTGDVETQQTQLSLLARSNISNVPEAVVLILLAGRQQQHGDGISSLMIRRVLSLRVIILHKFRVL